MTNIDMPTLEEYAHVAAIGDYQRAVPQGVDLDESKVQLNDCSRKNGQTPMQWDDSPIAGITTGVPWKRVNPNYTSIHVAAQESDPNSVLKHFRRMNLDRKYNPVLG